MSTAFGFLSSDVSCTNLGTWYHGPSVSLPTGNWLVVGTVTVAAGGETHFWGRMTDGTNVYASSQSVTTDTRGGSITLSGIVSGPKTVYMDALLDWTGGIIKSRVTDYDQGQTASQINAISN